MGFIGDSLADRVVVITGASSGIGRATAHAFVRKGARVVLAARREEPLRRLARELGNGRGIAIPTDVRDEAAVRRLGEGAVKAFGGLDVWFNNAGVGALGRFDQVPADVFRAVVETNLFGTVHGCRAALFHFKLRERGVLINNSSVMGTFGSPYASAYVSSKWAIRGLSESLRQELRDTSIEVCTLMPGTIDTPFFQHAANYTGRRVIAMKPVIRPERVARAAVSLAQRPRPEVVVGRTVALMTRQQRVAPRAAQRLMARAVERDHFADQPAPDGAGTVLDPTSDQSAASGGWKDGAIGKRAAAAAVGAGLAVAAGATVRARRH